MSKQPSERYPSQNDLLLREFSYVLAIYQDCVEIPGSNSIKETDKLILLDALIKLLGRKCNEVLSD